MDESTPKDRKIGEKRPWTAPVLRRLDVGLTSAKDDSSVKTVDGGAGPSPAFVGAMTTYSDKICFPHTIKMKSRRRKIERRGSKPRTRGRYADGFRQAAVLHKSTF